MQQTTITIFGKPVRVEWSEAADAALAKLDQPLPVEMELFFSCLVRKRVRFDGEASSRDFVAASDRLQVAFRPVMTSTCAIDAELGKRKPPLEDFHVVNPAAFVPHWLKISHSHKGWEGEFGY